MFQGEPMQQNASFAHNIDLLKKAANFFNSICVDWQQQTGLGKITDAC